MAKLFNNILGSLLGFGLAFLWTYYLTKSTFLAFCISAMFCIGISSLLTILGKHPTKSEKAVATKKAKTALALYLAANDCVALFEKIYSSYGYELKNTPCGFFAKRENADTFVELAFQLDKYSQQQLLNTHKTLAASTKLIVLCNDYEPSVPILAKTINRPLSVFNIDFVYSMLEKENLLPVLEPVKTKFAPVLSFALNKKRFKYWFLSALFLLVISVFSFAPVYSLIWATAFFLVAIFCLVNKRFNVYQEESPL